MKTILFNLSQPCLYRFEGIVSSYMYCSALSRTTSRNRLETIAAHGSDELKMFISDCVGKSSSVSHEHLTKLVLGNLFPHFHSAYLAQYREVLNYVRMGFEMVQDGDKTTYVRTYEDVQKGSQRRPLKTLKRIGDTHGLQLPVDKRGNWRREWGANWIMITVPREDKEGKKMDKYYFSPVCGYMLRSVRDVNLFILETERAGMVNPCIAEQMAVKRI